MNFRKILIATDFSDASRVAVDRGIDLALQFGAEIHLLHVVPTTQMTVLPPLEPLPDTERWVKHAEDHARELMDDLVRGLDFRECHLTTDVRVEGASATGIIEAAEREGADVIVLGTHGRRGLRRLMLGSVAEEVVRLAPCAVMVCSSAAADEPEQPRRIVAAVDFSGLSGEVLQAARDLGEKYHASVRVVHVVPHPYFPAPYAPITSEAMMEQLPAMLDAARENLRAAVEQAGPFQDGVDLEVASGTPSRGVLDAAEACGADLIVVASRGLGGAQHLLLGSVADRIVRQATCPVLVLHAGDEALELRSESA